jgi:hypothetical protein
MTSGLDDALCIHRSGAGTTREQQRDPDKVDGNAHGKLNEKETILIH